MNFANLPNNIHTCVRFASCAESLLTLNVPVTHISHSLPALIINKNLQAFQLIVLARYLLNVPNPSPVSQHALT